MKGLAILLLTCGVVFGIGSCAVLQPEQLDNERQERRVVESQHKVNEGRAALKSRQLFREEVGRLEQEADRWLSAATGRGLSELLSHLDGIGTACGVSLERHGGDASQNAARITVRGSKRQVLAFFAALRDDMFPFVADDLELFAVLGETDALQANLVVSSFPKEPGAEP